MLKFSGFAHRSPTRTLTDLSLTPLPLRASPVLSWVWVLRSFVATAEIVAAVSGCAVDTLPPPVGSDLWRLSVSYILHFLLEKSSSSATHSRKQMMQLSTNILISDFFLNYLYFSWQKYDVTVACFNRCAFYEQRFKRLWRFLFLYLNLPPAEMWNSIDEHLHSCCDLISALHLKFNCDHSFCMCIKCLVGNCEKTDHPSSTIKISSWQPSYREV